MSHLIRNYRAGEQVILTDEVRSNGFPTSTGSGEGSDTSLPATIDEARKLREEAQALLEEARLQATGILEEAQAQVETLEAAAQAQGYEAGYEQGLADGNQNGVEAMAQSVGQARELVSSFAEERARLLAASEEEVVALVMAIAEQVVGAVGRDHQESVLHNVRRALDQLGNVENFSIRVHPTDAGYLTELWTTGSDDEHDWKIQPDDSIAPGGCILSSGASTIDARISTQMRALVDGLCLDGYETVTEEFFLDGAEETSDDETAP